MIDIKYIREHVDQVKKGALDKKANVDIDAIVALDQERRKILTEVEELKCKQNQANQEVVLLKKEKKDIIEKIAELKEHSQAIKALDAKVAEKESLLHNLLLMVPNVPHESVPVGSEKDNTIVREWGEKKKFSFQAKDHLDLAEVHGYINMGCGAKITGSGFVLYQGFGAKLERALINYMIDFHTKKHGYTEISPPFIVNRTSMTGTGQLPKLEEDMYALKDDDFFLIPTAEVPVTNIHRDEILEEDILPRKYVAYSPCFRREAGSYGKDTRGLSRVHQFDKVELVKFVEPESSFHELEALVSEAEAILQSLGLAYRVVCLATGDLSFAASKCYDLEVWAPGSEKYFEVSSCSNFLDFQARRANIRFRDRKNLKPQYVHTLNGSGVALPRLVIALLENYQQEDGQITLPSVLEPYLR